MSGGIAPGTAKDKQPVAWQRRQRPSWDENHPWSDWEECTKDYHDDIQRIPMLHGWMNESRELYATRPQPEMSEWISVEDRLPEAGVTVMVYTPPQPGDWPESVRISFDGIDPESDGDYWVEHGEHYEHWCCIAKGGDDIDWHGPSEKAPYTHWMALPPPPQ